MNKFQTLVDIPQFNWKIDYTSSSMFMGSCFAENIGKRMVELKFGTDLNPFGILYNPISVANSLQILLDNRKMDGSELMNHNGLWHSFYHHSRFSSTDKEESLSIINGRITVSSKILREADFLFITFGTAWVYELKETQKVVSNCHKIPESQFTRYKAGVSDIVNRHTRLLKDIFQVNPTLKVIFTVSPIRHWKDGAIENQLSKSTLLLAVNKIINSIGTDFCAYFPSYEIVMDELRDYRFYDQDMIHLSAVATNHIWEKFEQSFMRNGTVSLKKEIEKILQSKNHRPFNPKTEEHKKFLSGCLKSCTQLEKEHPYINLKLEIEYFTKQLNLI